MTKREALAALDEVNGEITTVKIKGKDYAMVHERIKAFRKLYPQGRIETEVLYLQDGYCVIKATVYDDEESMLSSGIAYEEKNASTINKTSFVENCETSAIGRALGIAGIGLQAAIASADDMNRVAREQMMTGTEATAREQLIAYCDKKGIDLWEVRDKFGVLPGMNDEIVKAKFEMIKAEYGD